LGNIQATLKFDGISAKKELAYDAMKTLSSITKAIVKPT
jgi:hypothetical protein